MPVGHSRSKAPAGGLDDVDLADAADPAKRLRFVDGLDGDVAEGGGLTGLDRGDFADQSSRFGDGVGEARELTGTVLDTHAQDSVDAVLAHGM